jgi:hypothetical protein
MNLWWPTFGVPLLGIAGTIVGQIRSGRPKIVRIGTLCATVVSAISPSMGLYGLVKLDELAKRSQLDYGFEGLAWLFAVLGVIAAIFCLLVIRKGCKLFDWIPLAVSVWMFVVWAAVCSTL